VQSLFGEGLILITGASGGIGSATVARLSNQHILFGVDRQDPPADWRGHFLKISLNSAAAIQTVASKLDQICLPVDAAVFAAGTYLRIPIEQYDFNKLSELLWDNFISTFLLVRELLPRMKERRVGRLVIISSQAAFGGGFDPAYAASKGALQSLMKSVAREYGRFGIRCNAVSPGPVTSKMSDVMSEDRKEYYRRSIPIGRLLSVEEVAEAVCFLLSSDGINGATIDVDGGLLRR